MEWQGWAEQLVELLTLKRAPVAVTYTDSPPETASTGKCRVCGALIRAAQGEVIVLNAGNSTCPGGSMFLGLSQQPPERAKALREFVINGEKLYSCPTAFHRSRALSRVKPPFGLAEHIVFAPLASAPLPPDVTVFTGTPQQAARLVTLAGWENGKPMQCDPTGALCKSVITYPLVTGEINLSLGDITARHSEKYGDDEMFVTLPYAHLRSAIAAIPHCSAGTGKAVLPPAMRRVMEESGGEALEF
jgi:uncharacterized protein (DUF169 family)